MATFPGAIATDSDLYIAVNQTTTQLTDNPLTNVATTVNVVATAAFPTVGFISIDAEIIKYTGKTGTSFTGCTRGADGSTAASHAQNSQVYHNVIAAHHNVLKDEVKATEQFISDLIGRTNTQVLTPDGTTALPAHSFAAEPSSGLYRVGAGVVGISALNNLVVSVTSSKRVGINTSPIKVLDVRGDTSGLVLIAPTDDAVPSADIFQITNAALSNMFNISKAGAFTARASSSQSVGSGESKFTIEATAPSQSATLQLRANNATPGQCTIYFGDNAGATKGQVNYDPANNKYTINTNSITGFTLDSSQDLWSAVGASNNTKVAVLKFPTDTSAVRWAGIQGFRGSDAAHIDLRFFTMQGDSEGITERMRITTDGDVNSVPLTDYSGTSTVVGFSSTTTKSIRYKKLGKTIYAYYYIVGTGNNIATTFTLPFALNGNIPFLLNAHYAIDNGGTPKVGVWIIGANGTTVTLYPDAAGSNWTASGSRTISGTIVYETN